MILTLPPSGKLSFDEIIFSGLPGARILTSVPDCQAFIEGRYSGPEPDYLSARLHLPSAGGSWYFVTGLFDPQVVTAIKVARHTEKGRRPVWDSRLGLGSEGVVLQSGAHSESDVYDLAVQHQMRIDAISRGLIPPGVVVSSGDPTPRPEHRQMLNDWMAVSPKRLEWFLTGLTERIYKVDPGGESALGRQLRSMLVATARDKGLPDDISALYRRGKSEHCYWPVIGGLRPDDPRRERLLWLLAIILGGDPAVMDLARMMRVGGVMGLEQGLLSVQPVVEGTGKPTDADLLTGSAEEALGSLGFVFDAGVEALKAASDLGKKARAAAKAGADALASELQSQASRIMDARRIVERTVYVEVTDRFRADVAEPQRGGRRAERGTTKGMRCAPKGKRPRNPGATGVNWKTWDEPSGLEVARALGLCWSGHEEEKYECPACGSSDALHCYPKPGAGAFCFSCQTNFSAVSLAMKALGVGEEEARKWLRVDEVDFSWCEDITPDAESVEDEEASGGESTQKPGDGPSRSGDSGASIPPGTGTKIKLDMLGGKNPRPRHSEQNISRILSHDPRWKGVLAWDEHASRITFRKPPPFAGYPADSSWDDPADTATRLWLADDYRMTREAKVHPVVERVARLNPFHRLRDWLRRLEWDGTSRLDSWLSAYMGCTDTQYTRSVGAWWLMQAAARALRPGCQADYMLILEGSQGLRKSSALRALAGSAYFSDTLPPIGSKDFQQALRGKWILEFSELATLGKAGVETVKSLLPARVDTYRPSYGRVAEDFPRSCVFAGSTNDRQYLIDATGNRRFWPVTCGKVDLDALRRDREQLWAESVSRVDAGERYWPETPDEVALCTGEQDRRYSEDVWTPTVESWLRGAGHRDGVTVDEVLREAVQMDVEKWQHRHKIRVGAILAKLGWEQRRVRTDEGGRERRYFPPEDWSFANDSVLDALDDSDFFDIPSVVQ